jgi:hypothetical protein
MRHSGASASCRQRSSDTRLPTRPARPGAALGEVLQLAGKISSSTWIRVILPRLSRAVLPQGCAAEPSERECESGSTLPGGDARP